MKKRNVLSLILFLLLMLSLAGCNSSTSESTATKDNTQTAQQADRQKTNEASSKAAAVKNNSPDGSTAQPGTSDKKPAENTGTSKSGIKKPNIFGQVKSISGSKITLALAKMPQRSNEMPQGQPPAEGDAAKAQPPAEGDASKNPPAQGEKPAGPPPGAGASPELSGETKTITIPEGVKIVTGGRGESQEITIDKIKAGDMIEVLLKDAKADEIELVRVMQAK